MNSVLETHGDETGRDGKINGRTARTESQSIGWHQTQYLREEFSSALRALLMTPLMTSGHADFAAVRRHVEDLREWFARETGWVLHVERDCARLFKRPADLFDSTRGFPDYDRRRYVLFCLACAVLERADPQITLRVLGDRLLALAAEPTLNDVGFSFKLETHHERRELVAVCHHLLELGILVRVAGEEEGFVHHAFESGEHLHDALYDVQRRVLAGVLAAIRGPSTWAADEMPSDIEQRLRALAAEHVPDSDEARRTAMRRDLSRRLLDDPVVYTDALDATTRAYFLNQRGPMAARLSEAAGLVAEQRAEGLALADEAGTLTDISMPAEGTEAHITLLVAEYLSRKLRQGAEHFGQSSEVDIASFIDQARERYGRYWRRSAREPGMQRELAQIALERLRKLRLITISPDGIVRPLPAIGRFAVGPAEVREANTVRKTPSRQNSDAR
ncbi:MULTISPECIES: TIGR02678 family protein [unclassified Bradyrhizobium]|uniref:TIGR02678 family protein n=1 Tax=unclassified Bradyrhizobium TaxID=2631580 RepID=UPI003D1D9833